MTSNPVRSLKDTIRHYRITTGIKKALAFIGTSKNITQDQVKEMLKNNYFGGVLFS